jgi:DNA-binding NtrC family response regulator
MEKILIIDDELEIINGFTRILRQRYLVTGVQDPFQGELLFPSGQYAVIISDYHMPGMNGLELLRKAMEIAPDTVRILLTGSQDWDLALRAVNECSVFRFLAKPVVPEELIRVIDASIQQYRMNRILSSELRRQGVPSQKPVPICSYCKDIRISDADVRSPASWEHLEVVFNRRYGLQFSHGICPTCADNLIREANLDPTKIKR